MIVDLNIKNSTKCIINNIDLTNQNFLINLITEFESDKGLSITQSAGSKMLYQWSNMNRMPYDFTLEIVFGQQEFNDINNLIYNNVTFEEQIAIIETLILLNEPLNITFIPLNINGINQFVIQWIKWGLNQGRQTMLISKKSRIVSAQTWKAKAKEGSIQKEFTRF